MYISSRTSATLVAKFKFGFKYDSVRVAYYNNHWAGNNPVVLEKQITD